MLGKVINDAHPRRPVIVDSQAQCTVGAVELLRIPAYAQVELQAGDEADIPAISQIKRVIARFENVVIAVYRDDLALGASVRQLGTDGQQLPSAVV